MDADKDSVEFTAYEQELQLVKLDDVGAPGGLLNDGFNAFNDTGLALDHGSDGSLIHKPMPSFRFKQLDNDTDLNNSPTESQKQVHLENLMKNSRKQMSLRLHQGRVELAGYGDEYGYDDFNVLPDAFTQPHYSHCGSDEVVHFLGPAENIKTLFKLPYSQGRVSLAIHRVGNTLVVDGDVDEKDIPKGFDACNEVLRINHSQSTSSDSFFPPNLYENFIYQSTQTNPLTDVVAETQTKFTPDKKKRSKIQKHDGRQLPNVIPAFQRTFKWKFQDMKMILGSDVQLFSNKDHPAVSLKLHDVDKDMSLCTALDYYLDNVIANIPELAICMHSKGYVRGYQLIQTRDIPYLNGTSQPLFDIQDVNMNATMLFKFLQQNCSEANGTYWLYREEGNCSLRLYDVGMLSKGRQRKWKYMMAMLCYRFASRAARLIQSATETPTLQFRLRLRQRELLATCLELLEEIRRDESRSKAQDSICATVAEQMADTYLREVYPGLISAEKIDALVKAKQHLLHSIRVLEGCLVDYLRDRDMTSLAAAEDVAENVEDDEDDVGSFVVDEVLRLKLKHSTTCMHLATIYMESSSYSKMLESMHEACMFIPVDVIPVPKHPSTVVESRYFFQKIVQDLDFGGVTGVKSQKSSFKSCHSMEECRACVLETIGDMASVIDHDDSVDVLPLITTFNIVSGGVIPTEHYFGTLDNAFKHIQSLHSFSKPMGHDIRENLLNLAFFSYLRALDPPVNAELFFVLMKKLGNASNELGKYFLRRNDLSRAYLWFEGGSVIFEAIEDGVNVALLYANLANLHKVLAERNSFDAQSHYIQAIELCQKAHAQLKQCKANSELHAKVTGELALTYLVWAVQLSMIPTENISPILEKFNKALNLYVELGDQRQIAATHYQMASFYSQRAHNGSNYFGAIEVGKTFVIIHQELAQLYASSNKVEDIEHAVLVMLNTFDAYNKIQLLPSQEQEALNLIAPNILIKIQGYLKQIIRTTSSKAAQSKTDMFKTMYRETIYKMEEPLAQILFTLRNLYQ
ncbi:Aste57867_7710 [Aphanomyces stellatus]|uniref:Aste57867_7710 protein n=1 Tax=Aphanomyces stellatus TaxID=120398 RepID=A0A485KIN4_9STRA|nr:hypothetical protein As57867_007681 [Aphanomyces stellatus]VFT84613.1 Aste57867_7710 [Aphanomyces stellatus]